MNRSSVRSLFGIALLAASAAASAAGFPVASGEFSAIDQTQPSAAQPARNARQAEGRTRAEVMAEYEAARCRGELPLDGETGLLAKEVFPGRYPLPNCR